MDQANNTQSILYWVSLFTASSLGSSLSFFSTHPPQAQTTHCSVSLARSGSPKADGERGHVCDYYTEPLPHNHPSIPSVLGPGNPIIPSALGEWKQMASP